MPLLPTMATTGASWRTSVSKSMSENPAAPSPSMRNTCRSGRPWVPAASRAASPPRRPFLGAGRLPSGGHEAPEHGREVTGRRAGQFDVGGDLGGVLHQMDDPGATVLGGSRRRCRGGTPRPPAELAEAEAEV